MVLSRNGAGFTRLKGNSKQSCHFTKKNMEIVPFCIEWSMANCIEWSIAFFFSVLTLFILLSRSQNKAHVTMDQYFILALKLNVAVWSNHAVIKFIWNHFEAYFCKVFIFKKILKNSNLGFLVPKCVVGSRKIYPQTVWTNFDFIPSRSIPRNKILCW